MKIQAKITISRNSNNVINISIFDEASKTTFFEGQMTLEKFASAIVGLGYVEIDAEVKQLANVGKLKISEPRSVECPLGAWDKTELEKWLIDNCQEDGWTLYHRLRSQSSVVRNDNKLVLNYSVFKYVEVGQ